ncbi:MAG TPA: VWA domain-containing protein [bacterium]|nr:VWA domain-containing protein [bacterium]
MKLPGIVRSAAACVAAAVCAAGVIAAAEAQAAPKNILFIFDASGSMEKKIGGKTKLDIAKEVMTALVGDLPADANVGLEVYGNKENAGCDAIEMLIAVGKLDVAALRGKISSLVPGGKTPIAKSLEKGADQLKAFYGDKAIILVSDGEETCGGDPVKTAAQIKKDLGIDVVIHVVGFDVDDKAKQQLKGIAQAGGGSYYSAGNASELKAGLTKIKEEVVVPKEEKKTEQVKPEPAKAEQQSQLFLDEFEGDTLGAEWTVAGDDPDGRMVDKGILTVVAAKGSLNDDTAKNLILYKKDTLPENCDVVVKYRTEIFNSYMPKMQWTGLAFYGDRDNYLALVPSEYYEKLRILFKKHAKGEDAPDIFMDVKQFSKADTYYLKISKRKFKYTAYYGLVTGTTVEWKEVGSITVLGKKLYPGIFAFRDQQANEVTAEFDMFRIDEIK